MDNKSFEKFVNQDFNSLSNWINTLNPYEFALIGVIAAFLIAPTLNANQQNSIGNFLEEIGQILLAIAAQKITVSQSQQGNTTSQGIFDSANSSPPNSSDIDSLRKEIEELKRALYGKN